MNYIRLFITLILLIAFSAGDAERLKEELARRDVPVVAEIGEIVVDPENRIRIEIPEG